MSLWQSLNDLWDAFTEWLESIGEGVLNALKPLGRQIAIAGGMALVDAARQAVRAAEETGGSGREKFDAAQKAIIVSLEAQGLPIVINAINGAIEAAVAAMNNK
jgi:hypothetical protein